jgi:hypothetical protein
MTISFDNSGGTKVGAGTSATWTHTTATEAGALLLVTVDSGVAISGVTYNGVACTSRGSVTYNAGAEILSLWSLVSPAPGPQTIIATASGPTFIIGVSASYAGCLGTFGTLASSSALTGTASNSVITTGTAQLVYDVVNNTAATSNTPTGGQTKRAQVAVSGVAEGDIAATGGTMVLGWSFTAGPWAQISIPLNPAPPLLIHDFMDGGYGGVFQ